jgi:hypothetical protein
MTGEGENHSDPVTSHGQPERRSSKAHSPATGPRVSFSGDPPKETKTKSSKKLARSKDDQSSQPLCAKCCKRTEEGMYLCGGKSGLFCSTSRIILLAVLVIGFVLVGVFGILDQEERKECVFPSTCAGNYACLPTGYCNCTELDFRNIDLLIPHRPFACDLTRPEPPRIWAFVMWWTLAGTVALAVIVSSFANHPELSLPIVDHFEKVNKQIQKLDDRLDREVQALRSELMTEITKKRVEKL